MAYTLMGRVLFQGEVLVDEWCIDGCAEGQDPT
jgi:hypothetical protein